MAHLLLASVTQNKLHILLPEAKDYKIKQLHLFCFCAFKNFFYVSKLLLTAAFEKKNTLHGLGP